MTEMLRLSKEVSLNWNNWIRQCHRWLSIAFTATVVANFLAMGFGEPPPWVVLLATAPAVFAYVHRSVHVCAAVYRQGARRQRSRSERRPMINGHVINKHAGSCLCGAVRFEVLGEFERFFLCHCGRCRKDTGSAHAANLFSSTATVTWLSGEAKVKTFRVPATRHEKSGPAPGGSSRWRRLG